MARLQWIGIFAVSMVAVSASVGPVFAQPGSAAPPPKQTAANGADTDMGCRRQAAAQTGYSSSNPSDDAQKKYADAYYACMDQAYGPPGSVSGSGYGPPPPPYYYYPPYPYPYPYPYPNYGPYYYPPYYGPGVVFGFGFHRR
jgi:hypothetical protein